MTSNALKAGVNKGEKGILFAHTLYQLYQLPIIISVISVAKDHALWIMGYKMNFMAHIHMTSAKYFILQQISMK